MSGSDESLLRNDDCDGEFLVGSPAPPDAVRFDADTGNAGEAAASLGQDVCAGLEESLLSDDVEGDSLLLETEAPEEQFLVTNVQSLDPQLRACFVHACRALVGMRRGVLLSLLRGLGIAPHASFGRGVQAAACLFGMRLPVARAIWAEHLRCKKGEVAAAAGSTASAADGAAGSTVSATDAIDVPLLQDDGGSGDSAAASMTNIVRLVISSAAEGRSWLSFERDFARYRLAGGHPWICSAMAAAGQAKCPPPQPSA